MNKITELSEEQFRATITSSMSDVKGMGAPAVDIWPYVQNLSDEGVIPIYVFEDRLIEHLYKNANSSYEHVLLPTARANAFLCVVVDIQQQQIMGHLMLDLNKEYGYGQSDSDQKQLIQDNIDNYGCHLIQIASDNYLPGFVYSIGLYKKFRHPEIICFGLNSEVAASTINYACDLIKNGEILVPEQLYKGFLEGYSIQFLEVDKDHYRDYVGFAGWFYDRNFDFPLLQLVWPDKARNWPWEPNFNYNWKFRQPLLDRNTDFKFYEERNLAVYTTRQAFEGEPILYVYHNEEGDWQFHTSSYPDLNDLMMVRLEEITQLDPTINGIYHLQRGGKAWRANKEDEWEYEQDK